MAKTNKAKKIDRKDVRQIEPYWYQVKSQSLTYESWYDVTYTKDGFKCDCPNHLLNSYDCKHILAVQMYYYPRLAKTITLPDRAKTVKTIKPQEPACMSCGSKKVQKDGLRINKKHNVQRYRCKICGGRFSKNLGFEDMHESADVITQALQLYFGGQSYRNVARSLKLSGHSVSHMSVCNWIKKYSKLMMSYTSTIRPVVGTKWHADEIWMKVSGKQHYLFDLMDNKTRFWLAHEMADSKYMHNAELLLKMARDQAGITPRIFVTDGLPAYKDAFSKIYNTRKKRNGPKHVSEIHLRNQVNNNNIQERLNGEIRDREKVLRGLKKKDSPIIGGYRAYRNFIRPHEGIGGLTPAEMAGIEVHGKNKWITLIQNARLHNVHK